MTARARGAGTHFCLYSDRPSKISRRPCCHIDNRFRSSDTVKRHGLSTLPQLLDFDFKKHWNTHLQFRTFTFTKLELGMLVRGADPRTAFPIVPTDERIGFSACIQVPHIYGLENTVSNAGNRLFKVPENSRKQGDSEGKKSIDEYTK